MSTAWAAGIAPTRLEVNLASFPVDSYPTTSTGGGATNSGIWPGCPASDTVRACVQYFFNNNSTYGTVNPENYVAQGVTGVRFMFALWGGGGNPAGTSTPWDINGNVQTVWLDSLYQFFSDLHKYGIQYVTPDAITTATWTAATPTGGYTACPSTGKYLCYKTGVMSCGASETLYFFPWLPFGLQQTTYVPDNAGGNQAYNCAAGNSSFWGWSKFNNLMGAIAQQAQMAGLTVEEADIDNEPNLEVSTVWARLIYDNTTMTSVVSGVGNAMATYGFNSSRATVDVTPYYLAHSVGSSYDCGSVYGDSAVIDHSSQALAAFGGGKVGEEPYTTYSTTSLPCYNSASVCGSPGSPGWAACATAGMISLPVSQPVPSIQDLHAAPCLISGSAPNWGNCDSAYDTTAFAKQLYGDLWAFLTYRGLTSSVMMIGETTSNQPGSTTCEAYLQANATQNVNGYLESTLFTSDAAKVVMRPWENSRVLLNGTSCYATPAPIGTGYGPY
jgi:hypothetical protein